MSSSFPGLFVLSVLGVLFSSLICPVYGIASPDLSGAVYPATGTLHVDGDPVGMEVALDGRVAGQVPESGILVIENIQIGEHTLTASFPGYLSQQMAVTVPDGLPAEVRVTLVEEKTGSLDISSNPPQVQIFVDDLYKGITPATVDVPSGPHQVLLRLSGYEDWSSSVEARAGEVTPVSGTLIPVGGSPEATPSSGPEFVISLGIALVACLVAVNIRER